MRHVRSSGVAVIVSRMALLKRVTLPGLRRVLVFAFTRQSLHGVLLEKRS